MSKIPELEFTDDKKDINGDSLQTVLNKAHELMKVHPNLKTYEDFTTDTVQGDWSDSYSTYLMYKRPETVPEMKKRLADRAAYDARHREYERQQYEALKAKFEGKV